MKKWKVTYKLPGDEYDLDIVVGNHFHINETGILAISESEELSTLVKCFAAGEWIKFEPYHGKSAR